MLELSKTVTWTCVLCVIVACALGTAVTQHKTDPAHARHPTETSASTLRRFLPIPGKHKWMRKEHPTAQDVLFFNTSAIQDNEEVSSAQLHLHRRRLNKAHTNYHRKYLPAPYRVVLYQVQSNTQQRQNLSEDGKTMKLASLPVAHVTRGGWHTLDISPVLRELLINNQDARGLLLGVRFETPKGAGVSPKHFLKGFTGSSTTSPYKTSRAYLSVTTEIDPYFDEDDEDDQESNDLFSHSPTLHDPIDSLKERHFKHKLFKESKHEVSNEIRLDNSRSVSANHKHLEKYAQGTAENDVLKKNTKHRKEDILRHKKHRTMEVKRSKADELALHRKNTLKSVPFLHANEVEDIRQTSRRLTRSARLPSRAAEQNLQPMDRRVVALIQEEIKMARHVQKASSACTKQAIDVDLEGLDSSVVVPAALTVNFCSGTCQTEANGTCAASCHAVSTSPVYLLYREGSGPTVLKRLPFSSASDCECR